jgi:hypothetical protein
MKLTSELIMVAGTGTNLIIDASTKLYVFKPIWTFHVKKLKTLSILKLVNFF